MARTLRRLIGLGLAAAMVAGRGAALAQVQFFDINPNASTNSDADAATGGRVNALAGVPGDNNTAYAATEFGGMYKTTDGGMTWSRLNRHLPTRAVDVVVDPSNTSRVYATSQYDGRVNSISGIEVSTDAGATWSHPASATPPLGFACVNPRTEPAAFGIGIRPDATQNVFIGTNCGVARSTDSGVTWTFLDPETPAGFADNVSDVVVQAGGPTGQGIIDVCGDQRHHRSTDGGATWTGGSVGLPAGRCSIAVSPDESYVLFVYAADNNIYESDDGGGTWTNLGTPDKRRQGRTPFVRTNQRTGAGFDLWAGDVGLFRAGCTTPAMPAPGGALRCPAGRTGAAASPPPAGWAGPFTRTAGAHDDVGAMVFDTTVAVDACPRLFASDGGAHRNTNLGGGCQSPSWTRSNVGLHALWVFGMAGANQPGDTVEDLYFGAQDDGSFASLDAAAAPPTWTNPDCCDIFDVAAEQTRVVYDTCCTLGAGGTFISTILLRNRGMSGGGGISPNPPGTLPQFTFPDFIDTFGAKQYVAATTGAGGVSFTSDITAGAVAWTQLGAATSPANTNAVRAALAGGMPSFYATTIGGQVWRFTGTGAGTWQRLDNTDGLPGGFGVFAVDPTNPNRLFASTGAGFMFASTDGGLHWDGDPNLDVLMVGNGVFKRRQPTLVAFDPEDANVIVAGGQDSGVFLSQNQGQTWRLLTDPIDSGNSGIPHLPEPRFAYFDHEPAAQLNIYVATRGRGVWRIRLSGADLAVTKQDAPDPVVTATNLTYTITVTNQGPDTATGVTLTDTLPAGFAFTSASAGCSPSAGTVTCTLPNMTAHTSATVQIVGTASCSLADGAILQNTATVSGTSPDPDSGNNTAQTTTAASNPPPMITCPADIVRPNDPGLCSARVTYPPPTVVDNCPNVVVVCVPPSGSTFPKGTTPVQCTATDSGGATAQCGFTITVNDVEPPRVSCNVARPSLFPPNHDLVDVGFTASAVDNCPGPLPLVVDVTGDENDENGTGDGHHAPDATGIAPGTLRLRAERRGDADGRVYLITTSTTDISGNRGFTCCSAVVPHDGSPRGASSVAAQAGAARGFCTAHAGAAPPGYFVIGDGVVIGPKQ